MALIAKFLKQPLQLSYDPIVRTRRFGLGSFWWSCYCASDRQVGCPRKAHGRANPNSAMSWMMNMNNQGKRFYRHSTLGFLASAWLIGVGSLAIGQQGVAPPASGYGNRAVGPTNQQPVGPQSGGKPGGNPIGSANLGQAPGNPTNPTLNPTLNPALNQRPVSSQLPSVSGKEVVTKNPFPALSPAEQTHLDQVLNYWEGSTANIERYSCKLRRWQYNSSDNFVAELAKKLGTDIRNVNVSTADGELKYMAPDKGLFKIDKLLKLTGQLDATNQKEMKEYENVFGEWWLCDGEKVYEYDRSRKECSRFSMPPELRGAGILESPMPFMFGVKAEKIKARYWVRSLSPPNGQNGKPRDDIFVIEAYPKLQADAVNYDHVQIYLDRELFLPIMLVKFNPEHVDEPGEVLKDNREVFEFKDRVKNASLLQKFGELFRKEFIPFDIPKDWKVEDKIFAPPATDNLRAANNPSGQNPIK